ncbi:MAG: low molecular weight protein tyrosine phosphatase family protein [Spirosomataceae bacterium]
MPKTNLLFVCSRNKRRSLTAEMIFRNHEKFDVKSCGTSPQSRVKINEKLIRWADTIYVMEKRHKEIITQQFRSEIQGKILKVLFIPDEFELMDERLIEILQEKITS